MEQKKEQAEVAGWAGEAAAIKILGDVVKEAPATVAAAGVVKVRAEKDRKKQELKKLKEKET